MAMPVDLLDKIKAVFDAANVVGGTLEDINWIDWGSHLPPLASTMFPLIFITVEGSLHPEMRAARGSEEAYNEEYEILITNASYIIKTDAGEGGYKAAIREASNLFRAILTLCHTNKKWDTLCFTSEASEETPAGWGTFPFGSTVTGEELAYGITLALRCRARSS